MDNPQRNLTFLDLPDSARRTVYALAGLTRPCPIDLLARQPRSAHWPRGGSRRQPCWHLRPLGAREGSAIAPGKPWCRCPSLPLDLTLVSRAVSHEALDVLLGTNVFVVRVRAGQTEMLSPLAADIPVHHLARMRQLVVRLNCWPCPWGHEETSTQRPRQYSSSYGCRFCRTHTGGADPALSSSSPAARDLLDAWELVCARLGSSGLGARQLDLTLICDVDPADDDDGQVTSRLLDPMRCHLPLLRSCTLRLGRYPRDQNLARLAREAALALVGVETETVGTHQDIRPCPFDRLPWEVWTRIIQHTHLGPSGLAGYDPELERLDVVDGRVLPRPIRLPGAHWEVECCDTCTVTSLDCCCTNLRAAYSPTCTCRTLPTALFRVSRRMRRAAMEVFYPGADLRVRHHNLGAVLDLVPPPALPLLRRLTIALTPVQCHCWSGRSPSAAWRERYLAFISRAEPGGTRPKEGEEDYSAADDNNYRPDFAATLARLAAGADPSRLNLELDLRDSALILSDYNPVEEYRWAYDLYVDIAEMVCSHLPGLHGVRFHLAAFKDLEPWLAREVLGQRFVGSVEPPNGLRHYPDKVPSYHRMDQRIRGSQYHGDVGTGVNGEEHTSNPATLQLIVLAERHGAQTNH